jgi:glycosyltransferase involved in cell wall biosynthesis
MSKDQNHVIFISWATDCARSDAIAHYLHGKSFLIYSPFWGSHFLTIIFKYISQTVKTLRVLHREKPRFVFVMTPPVVACFPVWLYTRITGGAYAIDAHTAAFLDPRWRSIGFLHRFFSRHALATLVTNEYLRGIVESWNARATIVADVPIDFREAKSLKLEDTCAMTFISSFTQDEPLSIFLDATTRLPEIRFYITGDFTVADPNLLQKKPSNVEFTGFLPKSDYGALLKRSDAIICLTTLEHTMQRGAYEAVYLGKPVVTSNTELLKKSFPRGAVHVDGTVESIVEGIKRMKGQLDLYRDQVQELRSEKLDKWKSAERELRRIIAEDL